MSGIPGVAAEQFVPEFANAVPHVGIDWDSDRIALTRADVAAALRAGEPRIEPRPSAAEASRLEIGVWMMQPGDAQVVAERCAEVLVSA